MSRTKIGPMWPDGKRLTKLARNDQPKQWLVTIGRLRYGNLYRINRSYK